MIETKLHYTDKNQLTVERTQDVEPILEANKQAYNSRSDHRQYAGKDMAHVARVPMVVIEQWMKEGINAFDPDHEAAIMRKLNSPEYRYLRTRPGKI